MIPSSLLHAIVLDTVVEEDEGQNSLIVALKFVLRGYVGVEASSRVGFA
jgi:hypothetical protein